MKRTISLALVLAMLFSAMLGVISFADEGTKSVETYSASANLEFADTVYLLIAVKCPSSVTDTSKVTVKISNPLADVKVSELTADPDVPAPDGCIGFKYTNLSAKNMGDELTIDIYNNGSCVKSMKYSVLEYALRIENSSNSDGMLAIVKSMIKYAAKAQTAYGHKGTYDLEDDNKNLIDYSLVRLVGGATFAGTNDKKAIMRSGDDALIAQSAYGNATDVWYNMQMQERGVGATYSVEYSEDNITLFSTTSSIVKTGVDYTSPAIMNHADIPAGDNYFINTNSVNDKNTEYDIWTRSKDIGTVVGTYPDNPTPATDLAYQNRLKWSHGGDKNIGTAYLNTSFAWNKGTIATFNKANGYLLMSTEGKNVKSASAYRMHTGWGEYLKAIAEDESVNGFTVSLTLAGLSDVAGFSYISLRRDLPSSKLYYGEDGKAILGKGGFMSATIYGDPNRKYYTDANHTTLVENFIPYGRLNFFGNATAGTMTTYLSADGYTVPSDKGHVNNVITGSVADDVFITVHAVFVFEDKGMRIDYYIGDNTEKVATVALDFMKRSYFETGDWSFDTFLANNCNVKLKTLVLSSGNVMDYYK